MLEALICIALIFFVLIVLPASMISLGVCIVYFLDEIFDFWD